MTEHRPIDYRPIVIIALLVALTVNGALVAWAFWYGTQQPHVTLSKPSVESDTELCPGDTLDYNFTLSVTKKASVDLYTIVDRTTQNDHIAYTRLQQFQFDSPTDLEINRHWQLPPTHLDPVTGTQTPWFPGPYIQRTTAAVANGREEPARIEVPFAVRAACP